MLYACACYTPINTVGLLFHYKLSWSLHKKAIISSTNTHLSAIVNFHFNSGNQFIPAAIQIFKSKIISHLFYGVPLWIQVVTKDIDRLAASFFRKILGIPNLIRLSFILIELGLHLPSTYAWLLTFKFWLKIHLTPSSDSLISVLLKDSYVSSWFRSVEAKLSSINLSIEALADLSLQQAYSIIRENLFLAEFNFLKSTLNPICSPLFFGLSPQYALTSNYFFTLTNPQLKRAFLLARFNIFPSAVHYGRFLCIPRHKRLCLFCKEVPDTLSHILFFCPHHSSIRQLHLATWFSYYPPSCEFSLSRFMEDAIGSLTFAVARYLALVLSKTPAFRQVNLSLYNV